MALWQYDFYLLPKSEVVSKAGLAPERIDRELFDGNDWWLHVQLLPQLLNRLSQSLAEGKSWSPDIKTWGTEDGNRVDVVLEDDRIADVFVRVDVRYIQFNFVRDIVSLANDLGLVLLTPEMRIVDPDADGLMALIAKSDAAKFVENPVKFLTGSESGLSPDDNEH